MKHRIVVSLLTVFLLSPAAFAAESYTLTLEEATRLAIAQSFDIQIAKFDAQIAKTDELSAKSLYDLIMDVEATYTKDKSKKTSTILGTKSQDNEYNVGLSQTLPSGTTVDLFLNNTRSSTNSSFATNTTTHESVFGAEITQDLGRNLFGLQDRGDIKVRLLDIESAEYSSLDRIEDLMVQVQKAYLDVVLAQEVLNIDKDMLMTAEKLYEIHSEKFETGLVEKAELFASEANFKKREDEVKIAENNLAEAVNVLRLLLALEVDDDVVIQEQFAHEGEVLDHPGALKKAFKQRMDYKRMQTNLQAQDIKLKMKKQNLWPEINLTASYERNGLKDDIPGAVENITEEDNPTYFVGVSVEFPLQNRDARAKVKAQRLEKLQMIASAKKLERQIVLNVTDKVRNANVYREIVKSRAKVAELETAKLAEEEKRFSRGRSNTDTLVRFQEDAIQARLREVQSKYTYSLALVELRREEGSLIAHFWDEEF